MVGGITTKVDDAVQAANDAKEHAKKVGARIRTETKHRELWQAGMEERFAAIEFVEPAAEVKPTDPEIQRKLTEIEERLAGMSAVDPWTAGRSMKVPVPTAAANGSGSGMQFSGKGKGGGKSKKRAEEKTMTAFFTIFPKGSRSNDIKAFVNENLGAAKEQL